MPNMSEIWVWMAPSTRYFSAVTAGIFKLRQPPVAGAGDWVSAAVPGSGMNSLQMTDLAGTNRLRNDGAPISTSLYFSTQDNNIWASADGGEHWPTATVRRL